MKMMFYFQANKTHFHKNSFVLSLVFKSKIFKNSEMATEPSNVVAEKFQCWGSGGETE